ncbi:hypothetical protein [Actinoallomurus sp. CA-150999]
MTVDLLQPAPPMSGDEITFLDDIDALSDGNLRSCSAGDDNPF